MKPTVVYTRTELRRKILEVQGWQLCEFKDPPQCPADYGYDTLTAVWVSPSLKIGTRPDPTTDIAAAWPLFLELPQKNLMEIGRGWLCDSDGIDAPTRQPTPELAIAAAWWEHKSGERVAFIESEEA